jgi:hypothetical protein
MSTSLLDNASDAGLRADLRAGEPDVLLDFAHD